MTKAFIHQGKSPGGIITKLLKFTGYIKLKAGPLKNKLVDPFDFFRNFFGDGNYVFNPVNFLAVAMLFKMFPVIRIIIKGRITALLGKSLNQDSLAVKIGKSKRAVNTVAADTGRPFFDFLKKKTGNVSVIYKIKPSETEQVSVPGFIMERIMNRSQHLRATSFHLQTTSSLNSWKN